MKVSCPYCDSQFELPRDFQATKARCSVCREKFILEEAPSATPHRLSFKRHVIWGVGIGVVVIAATVAWAVLAPILRFDRAMGEGYRAEKAEQWDEALAAYCLAESVHAKNRLATNAIMRVLVKRDRQLYVDAMQRAARAEALNEWQTAVTEYEKALSHKPNDLWAKSALDKGKYQIHLREAREWEMQQRWEAALAAYAQALGLQPLDQEATEGMRRMEQLLKEIAPRRVVVAPASAQQPSPNAVSVSKPATKPTELSVTLVWEKTEGAAERDIVSQMPAGNSQDMIRWIADRVIQKAGGERVAVTTIPLTDQDGWWCGTAYDTATNEENPESALFQSIGQHLLMADHLLKSGDIEERRHGLGIAIQAARGTVNKGKDFTLAVAIHDTYVLPNLDAADPRETVWLGKVNVIKESLGVFIKAGDTERMAKAYKLLIEHAPSHVADTARIKLAELNEKSGNFQAALQYLRDMTPENRAGKANLIAQLERKIGSSQQKTDGGRNEN
jgi:tetratricopeptide (TPR) repeat protein